MLIFTPDHWSRLPEELQSLDSLESLLARAEGLTLRRYRQKGEVRLDGFPDDPALMGSLVATIADVAAFLHDRPEDGVRSERVGQRQTVYTSRSLPSSLFSRLDAYDTRVPYHMGL